MASVTSVHSNDGDRLHRGCISPQWRGFWLHPAGAKTGRPKGVGHTPPAQKCPVASELWGQGGGYIVLSQVQDLYPLYPPQVKDATCVKILSKRL